MSQTEEENGSDSKTTDVAPQSEAENVDAGELGHALDKLSDERPDVVSQFMGMVGTAPGVNPLHKKMTDGHIDKVLDLAADHDKREYDLHQESQQQGRLTKWLSFAGFVLIVGLVVLVLVLFQDQPRVLVPTLTGIGGLSGGFLGGWGLGRRNA